MTNSSDRRSDTSQRDAQQKAAFDFLLEKYKSQETFTRDQFQSATGFSEVSFRTYLSKQFRELLVKVDESSYRVNLAFRQFSTWPKFRDNVVTQNRRLTRQYIPTCYENVVMFEFFMPLRNEEYLRVALDALFFSDSIKARLRTIDQTSLRSQFPVLEGETAGNYLERICKWIGDKFIGYSINHVTGRFRVGDLKNRREVSGGDRYFLDETTAIVRFIFPCDERSVPMQAHNLLTITNGDKVQEEADNIRWCFKELFVESILEVVNGEDEIWLLESGMQNQLHIYRIQE